MSRGRGTAYARAALLGNPSDGYGGRTISFVFTNLSADVEVEEARRSVVHPEGRSGSSWRRRWRGSAATPRPPSNRPRRPSSRFIGARRSPARSASAARARSSSPPSVALCSLYGVSIPRVDLPAHGALGRDRGARDRGRAAGPGGADLRGPHLYGLRAGSRAGRGATAPTRSSIRGCCRPCWWHTSPVPPRRHPGPTAICGDATSGGIRTWSRRWTEIAGLARLGRECLLTGDHDGLRRALDRNFDARRRLYPLDPRHTRMIEAARSAGASANYAGSGGAITAIPGRVTGSSPSASPWRTTAARSSSRRSPTRPTSHRVRVSHLLGYGPSQTLEVTRGAGHRSRPMSC